MRRPPAPLPSLSFFLDTCSFLSLSVMAEAKSSPRRCRCFAVGVGEGHLRALSSLHVILRHCMIHFAGEGEAAQDRVLQPAFFALPPRQLRDPALFLHFLTIHPATIRSGCSSIYWARVVKKELSVKPEQTGHQPGPASQS